MPWSKEVTKKAMTSDLFIVDYYFLMESGGVSPYCLLLKQR
jgi:hypothetical protein